MPLPFTSALLLFPAYAGVILVADVCRKYRQPFPRIRGGDP